MPLPEPSPDAHAHSLRLSAHIRNAIVDSDGWLPFSRYMELALYAPGLGYYSAGTDKLGPGGDFVTAPELSPFFARALARQVAQVLDITGGAVLELGAGSGRLAADLLRGLAELGSLPARYAILEVSPDLRARQQARLRAEAPEWLDRIAWLDRLPEQFEGVIIGNEVLDALPVHLLVWTEHGVAERGVTLDGGAFAWRDRTISNETLKQAVQGLPAQAPGYLSEVNLAAEGLIRSLAERLHRGVLLFVDYGFPRSEYYHPQRAGGTLMCHYRHHAHANPFYLPGLQDITAHVDFSAMADAAFEAGLEVAGYAGQAGFLIDCGLLDLLATLDSESEDYLRQIGAVQKLIQPSEMGELFKVLALSCGMSMPLCGFDRSDRRHTL